MNDMRQMTALGRSIEDGSFAIIFADGQERIAILPGTYGLQDLVEVLRRFDTVVLMKIVHPPTRT